LRRDYRGGFRIQSNGISDFPVEVWSDVANRRPSATFRSRKENCGRTGRGPDVLQESAKSDRSVRSLRRRKAVTCRREGGHIGPKCLYPKRFY
jgi:hypothetical protein